MFLSIYGNENICQEYPIDIEFESEEAIDHGGVQREMFSAFWEQAYLQPFEGATILIPLLHPQTDTVFGRILSHGYLVTGFLPIRIALPTLICMLLVPGRLIPSDIVEGSIHSPFWNNLTVEDVQLKSAVRCMCGQVGKRPCKALLTILWL